MVGRTERHSTRFGALAPPKLIGFTRDDPETTPFPINRDHPSQEGNGVARLAKGAEPWLESRNASPRTPIEPTHIVKPKQTKKCAPNVRHLSYNISMRRITKRDLNHRMAEALESVTLEEPLIVTERGVEKWSISLLEPSPKTINGLEISKPATNPDALLTIKPRIKSVAVSDVLDDLRDDRL